MRAAPSLLTLLACAACPAAARSHADAPSAAALADPPGHTTARTGSPDDFAYFAGEWTTLQRRLKARGVGSDAWRPPQAMLTAISPTRRRAARPLRRCAVSCRSAVPPTRRRAAGPRAPAVRRLGPVGRPAAARGPAAVHRTTLTIQSKMSQCAARGPRSRAPAIAMTSVTVDSVARPMLAPRFAHIAHPMPPRTCGGA